LGPNGAALGEVIACIRRRRKEEGGFCIRMRKNLLQGGGGFSYWTPNQD
jgi:hypothetical protein